MTDFESIIGQIYTGASLQDKDVDTQHFISIDKNRQLIPSPGFNTVIAFEGDINAQIITFKCPRFHENIDLSQCNKKELRWSNANANTEGVSELKVAGTIEEGAEEFSMEWLVPPELSLKNGDLKISVSIYNVEEETGKIVFAWNTATLHSLKVGSTSTDITSGRNKIPAKNEILFINTETRKVVAPSGYNNVIANYGDINTSEVYFQAKRYFKSVDLMGDDVDIKVTANFGDQTQTYSIDDKTTNFADGQEGEGLINFTWHVPQEITYNEEGYIGNIAIVVTIRKNGEGGFVWRTSTFS